MMTQIKLTTYISDDFIGCENGGKDLKNVGAVSPPTFSPLNPSRRFYTQFEAQEIYGSYVANQPTGWSFTASELFGGVRVKGGKEAIKSIIELWRRAGLIEAKKRSDEPVLQFYGCLGGGVSSILAWDVIEWSRT